jgi:hypothetical protein
MTAAREDISDESGDSDDSGNQSRCKGRVNVKVINRPPPSNTPPTGHVWVKKINEDVRTLYNHTGCRREWLDKQFDNPPRRDKGEQHAPGPITRVQSKLTDCESFVKGARPSVATAVMKLYIMQTRPSTVRKLQTLKMLNARRP